MTKTSDLQTRLKKEIAPELKKTLGIKSDMAIPKIVKIKINTGIGTYIKSHNKDYSGIVESITKISGQKPVITKSKKAISNFKIRQGEEIGITVTLRGKRMYDFLTKLVNIVFPRVRDFRGLSPKSFDGKGNYSVGFKEHTVFPEISPDDVMKIHGLQISIITSAENNEEGRALLKAIGFPFKQVK
ncbi:MAG: 50S ribosomal protein L5 [Candidatus Peregrinibacteria bacterium]